MAVLVARPGDEKQRQCAEHAGGKGGERGGFGLLPGFAVRLWPLLLGNVLEWYEFAVYGFLVPQITTNFFQGSAATAWLAFAVNFVVRPLGGLVFGWAADRFGRRNATVVSVLGMLVATVGQGLLPSYYCCGPAAGSVGTVLILTLRALQGFCTGGESAGILPYIIESVPGQIRCTATCVFMATMATAFCLASSFAFLLRVVLDEADMMLWGWRLPFLVCVIPGTLSLWGRGRLPESPEFLEWQEKRRQQLEHRKQTEVVEGEAPRSGLDRACSLCRDHAASWIVVVLGSAAGGLAWNQALWALSYARASGLPEVIALGIGSVLPIVIGATGFAVAIVSDMKGLGPYPALLFGTLCMALGWTPVFSLLQAFPGDPCVAALCILLGFGVLLGLALGTYHFFFACIFPTEFRGRLFGTAWNVSLAVFAGFAGAISEALLKVSPHAPPLYVSAVSMISFATLLLARRTQAFEQMQLRVSQSTVAGEHDLEHQKVHVSAH